MKKLYIALVVGVLLILGGWFCYKLAQNGYVRMNYPSSEEYLHGIDVSHHQQEIDWDVLLSEESDYVQFVYMKSTEGATHVDSLFKENWDATRLRNVPRGAYHYFTFCTSGEEQARNYIDVVPVDSLALPPAVDLEFGGNCKEENRLDNYIDEVKKFITILEAHYNKKVVIYSTRDFYEQYIVNDFLENPIWFRDIIKKPTLEKGRSWLIWQYTNRGKLKGINTPVDINAFDGDKEGFQAFIKRTIVPSDSLSIE